MPRMIELFRQAAVPANLMRAAARGALSLPASEMLEVLVLLTHNPVFAEQARLTLAGWDHASAFLALSDPAAPPSVIGYFLSAENRRQELLPALLENPSVRESRLLEMASTASRESLSIMLASKRVRSKPAVLRAVLARPELTVAEAKAIKAELRAANELVGDTPGQDILELELASDIADDFPDQDILELEVTAYLRDHAAEIAAAENQAFHLVGPTPEEQAEIAAVQQSGATGIAARAMSLEKRERVSPIQKISRLSVGERVQLALKGNREERLILIRDGVRVISNAVLQSPRVNDPDVELFASMRNVAESVLRGIAGTRKFMKSYAVKRILTANPRCPLEVVLPLVKELLVSDLKHLSINKNVSDTVRKFALKVMKEKATTREN